MRIGLVTDLHWVADGDAAVGGWHNPHDFRGVPERLAAALGWFSERSVDVIAIGGDLAHGGDVGALAAVVEVCRDCSAPVVIVAGNHDVAPDEGALRRAVDTAAAPRDILLSALGFMHHGIRVAGVSVAETDGWFGARLQELPPSGAWGADAVVLVSHFPLLSRAALLSEHGFPYPGDLLDRSDAANALLCRPAPTVVLSGHIHARDSHAQGPVLQFSQGALVEAPYECALVEVSRADDGALWVWRDSGRMAPSDVAREPVFAPALEAWRFDGAQWRLEGTDAPAPAGADAGQSRRRAGGAQEAAA